MRGLFVSGTDTGAGKSMVAASICAALAADGERVAAFKPVVTGLAEPVGEFPPDHELLARAAGSGQSPAEVAPYRYDPPLSPHYAAELAGETIEPARLVEYARAAAPRDGVFVVEGVGGLLVPLSGERVTGHVDAPDAVLFFADQRTRGSFVRVQPLHPMPQRFGVVRPQAFHVEAFELRGLHQLDFFREMRDFAAWSLTSLSRRLTTSRCARQCCTLSMRGSFSKAPIGGSVSRPQSGGRFRQRL